MANVIVRFSVFSHTEEKIDKLSRSLPFPTEFSLLGEAVLLSNGLESGKTRKETSFTYVYEFQDIFDIEICSRAWMDKWKDWGGVLEALRVDHNFFLDLNYEITVFDSAYPSLYFQPEFTSFIGKVGVQFSLYFYNG